MTSVDITGWLGDLINFFGQMQDTKFWAIDKNEIYIKVSEPNAPENLWKLWAVNVTSDPPTRVFDSIPTEAYVLATAPPAVRK